MTSATSIELRFTRLRAGALVPERQTSLASGYDLHASIEGGSITIGQSPVSVPTGIAVAAPAGADVQIRPRSGLFARGVIGMLGTIDADYRGELHVTLYCLPDVGTFEVKDGDRIAQIVVSRLTDVVWQEAESLDETERGVGGHGSTGLQ
ncbi:MAG TPA: dUTP diphosphatase [Dehalococcoidia bacterium]|nr:dUTP diphosphatase [Dehalococcoidia bacterium]